jgi:4-hydroxyphenylacetate 3-monooxygenase
MTTPTVGPAPAPTAATQLVVAGYTGSDEAAVRHHIEELAAIGVPAPASVPAYYPLDRSLLTTDPVISVDGGYTSGEVEPVLVRAEGTCWLTVGSDHTDRDLERDDIGRSKAACPKPVATQAIRLGEDPTVTDWDRIRIRSWVDGDLYQDGTLAALRPLADTLARCPAGGGDLVLFGGTVPLLDGTFRAGTDWRLTLEAPGLDPLELRYSVKVRNP